METLTISIPVERVSYMFSKVTSPNSLARDIRNKATGTVDKVSIPKTFQDDGKLSVTGTGLSETDIASVVEAYISRCGNGNGGKRSSGRSAISVANMHASAVDSLNGCGTAKVSELVELLANADTATLATYLPLSDVERFEKAVASATELKNAYTELNTEQFIRDRHNVAQLLRESNAVDVRATVKGLSKLAMSDTARETAVNAVLSELDETKLSEALDALVALTVAFPYRNADGALELHVGTHAEGQAIAETVTGEERATVLKRASEELANVKPDDDDTETETETVDTEPEPEPETKPETTPTRKRNRNK